MVSGATTARVSPAAPSASRLWRLLSEADRGRQYHFGTHRSVPPSETLRRIQPLLRPAGITRLANITDLDWIGIPVWQAIHPNSRLYSVSQGKGLTHAQAQVSASMEGLEQFHAAHIQLSSVTETVGAMHRQIAYDPYALVLSEPSFLNDAMPIEWLPATDLTDGTQTWVPRAVCDCDGTVSERLSLPLFRVSTNGLASGNTVAEALVHALSEVVERDAVSRRGQGAAFVEVMVDLDTVSSRLAQQVLKRFERAGLTTLVTNATGPTGVPCFEVWVDHPDGPALGWGSGAHPRRATALIRALTEAAQARATYIAGSRDDLGRTIYRRNDIDAAVRHYTQTVRPHRSFLDAPDLPRRSLATEVHDMVRRIKTMTGMAPVAVDLTRPDFDLPVVFVVAPGLQEPRH
jgi:ribosomal protein S12 methylthiotransferase accessory factor